MARKYAEAKSPKCLVGREPKGYHSEENDKSDAGQPMAGTWDFFCVQAPFQILRTEWFARVRGG